MRELLVFAGPNGSGKSTITQGVKTVGDYINADLIKTELSCSDIEAAKIATATREYYLSNKLDFTFETVMSKADKIELLQRAKEIGYRVVCIYVLTKNPNINIERVKKRVRNGGHNVSEEKIRTRYRRALNLFPKLFTVCDEMYVFDNSKDASECANTLILEYVHGIVTSYPNSEWSENMIVSLVKGTYTQDYLKNS